MGTAAGAGGPGRLARPGQRTRSACRRRRRCRCRGCSRRSTTCRTRWCCTAAGPGWCASAAHRRSPRGSRRGRRCTGLCTRRASARGSGRSCVFQVSKSAQRGTCPVRNNTFDHQKSVVRRVAGRQRRAFRRPRVARRRQQPLAPVVLRRLHRLHERLRQTSWQVSTGISMSWPPSTPGPRLRQHQLINMAGD